MLDIATDESITECSPLDSFLIGEWATQLIILLFPVSIGKIPWKFWIASNSYWYDHHYSLKTQNSQNPGSLHLKSYQSLINN